MPTSATVAQLQLALRQKSWKLAAMACGLRPEEEAEADEAEQRGDFGEREDVLNHGAGADAARVDDGQNEMMTAMARSCCVVRPSLPEPSR